MVAKAERAGRRRASWMVGRLKPWRTHVLAFAGLACLATTGGLAVLCFECVAPVHPIETVTIATLGLAALGAIAALSRGKDNASVSGRLDILRRALDAAPEAQLIVDPDGRLGYANIAFDQLCPGRNPPLDRILRAVLADGESQAQFRRLRGRAESGSRATVTLCLSKARTDKAARFEIRVDPIAGYPGYSFWTLRDVSAHSESETAIRQERNTLADFLDNAPVGFYSVDSAGRFRMVSRTLAQWLDTTPSEIIASGAQLHDFLVSPPADGTPSFNPFAAQNVAAQRGEVALKTRRGRVLPAWIGQNLVGSGTDLHTRSVVSDWTPQRECGAALKSAERFRRCFANAPVGIALLDGSGRFEEANRAVGELFGAAPQSLKGRELIGLLNDEDGDRIAAKLAAVAAGSADSEPVEVRPKRPGDKTMVLFLSRLGDAAGGTPPAGAGGQADSGDGLTLHFIDVSEQKHLELQFAQSQKMQAVGQLAGGVAHDFNNLLTAMIGFCDLLLLRSPPSDPSFADIMQIKQNANRAANLVRQLLAFSRQQTLQPRVLDVTDILYELRHLIERLIGENIRLDVVHGRDLGLVKVDQGQFEQVIINLAVNARDAMPGGGGLTIRTANVRREQESRRGHEVMPAGDYVLVEMADTGVGIAKENLARIFDPFFSTKELGSGTGLGLSTVYGIVKQTGGFVFVSSVPGRGAAFEIYLPRCQAADGARPSGLDIAETPAIKDLTGHGTIMLVEDDDPVRIFGARALRNKGYRVIEARSGEAALDLIRRADEKFDLLITDVVMPHMDGPGLVREVREIHSGLKVIYISGYTEDAFRQRLDSDGGIDFLPKPFSLKQLAAKVRDVLAVGAA
jgi:two-component system cell cycle sensor histidine kinase/response regulator CckA